MRVKYIAVLSHEHGTGLTLLNEYWVFGKAVVNARTTNYETGLIHNA